MFLANINSVELGIKYSAIIDKYDINSYKKMANPSNMNKMMNPTMHKMPSMNIPKF